MKCVCFGAEVDFSGDADECRGRGTRGVMIISLFEFFLYLISQEKH